MARIFKVRAPATHLYLEPLDAWTARRRVQRNTEAVYEEARDDGRVILQAYYQMDVRAAPWGPVPIRMRMDRNGLWRTQMIDILYAPGSLDGKPVWAVLTDTYRHPTWSGPGDPLPDGTDPYAEWSPAATTTPAWLGAQAITPPREWAPQIIDRGSEDERGRMRIAWLTVWYFDVPAGDKPRIAGYRHYELVEDEP